MNRGSSILVSLGVFLLSLSLAAGSEPEFEIRHGEQRELLTFVNDYDCNAVTWSMLRAINKKVDTCQVTSFNWDPNGFLTVMRAFGAGWIDDYDIPIRLPVTLYEAYYNGQKCTSFQKCGDVYDYAYDCSNVYCGPNAKRECGGAVETVLCTGGQQASFPEIPMYSEVKCLQERAHLEQVNPGLAATCTQCTEDVDQNGVTFHSYVCTRPCLGCIPDGTCVVDDTTDNIFSDSYKRTVRCHTNDNTNKRFCTDTQVAPLHYTLDGYLAPSSTFFSVTWEGKVCASSVCGYNEYGIPLLSADCSDVTGIDGTIYDQCTGTFEGGLEYLGVNFDLGLTCPGGGIPQLAPPKDNNQDGSQLVTTASATSAVTSNPPPLPPPQDALAGTGNEGGGAVPSIPSDLVVGASSSGASLLSCVTVWAFVLSVAIGSMMIW